MLADNNEQKGSRVDQWKRMLEPWKELVVEAHHILIWKQDWYPAAIAASVLILFLTIWAFNVTCITLFSLVAIAITLVDYAGATVLKKFLSRQPWDGPKEAAFVDACQHLDQGVTMVLASYCIWKDLRSKNPMIHCIGTVLSLLLLAWIGHKIPTFVAVFLMSMTTLLLPGLHKRGILSLCFSKILSSLSQLMKKNLPVKKAQ